MNADENKLLIGGLSAFISGQDVLFFGLSFEKLRTIVPLERIRES